MIQGETLELLQVVLASVTTAAATIGGLLGVQKYQRRNGNPGHGGNSLTRTHVENIMLKHNQRVTDRYERLTAAIVKEGEGTRDVLREGFKTLNDRWDRAEGKG